MASVMTWEDKIIGDSFKNIINATIKHLNKNNALKISEGEALELFNLPAKKQAVSVLRRQDVTPQEKAMAIMAKYLKKRNRSAKATIRQSFRTWTKATLKARKQAEKEASKAEKQAELEAQKQAKKDAREAKKAEKLAAIEVEKEAKKAEKEAKKAEKQAAIAKEKEEAKATNEARKLAEKEAKKAEREAKKAEKAKKIAVEREAKKLAMKDMPCDKCYEGSGKMMGHRGRHTLEPKCQPCSPASETKDDDGVFIECPKCPPGSGKKKGHRGKCKGAKKVSVKEESTELTLDDITDALNIGSATQDDSDDETEVVATVSVSEKAEGGSDSDSDSESDSSEEGSDELGAEDKITIDGVDYYKSPIPIQGVENILLTYPMADEMVGVLGEDGKTIGPLPTAKTSDED